MLLMQFTFFMLFLTICNGIKCVDEIQMQLSVTEIASLGMERIFHGLKTGDSMKCQVYMEFDSIAQKFKINFGQSLVVPRLHSVENTYINIATSIISVHSKTDVNQTSIQTIVYFVCYSNDECDRQLALEHVDWLINNSFKRLESTIRPSMLVQGDRKNECTVGSGSTVQFCNNTACSRCYSINTKQDEGNCENAYSPVLPALELTTEIRMFEKVQKPEEKGTGPVRAIFKHSSSMKFWCELSNCNDRKVTEAMKEVVSKENNLWSTLNIQ